MSQPAHQCSLPWQYKWVGHIYRCPECQVWFEVVVFHDEEEGLAWYGWQKLELVKENVP